MSRRIERKVAKELGVPHSIFDNFTNNASTRRKEKHGNAVIARVGLAMREVLVAAGWKVVTVNQALAAMQLDDAEFRCTAVRCGCVGQRVELYKEELSSYVLHTGHNAEIIDLFTGRLSVGAGRALLISPRTRKQLGI